MKNVVGPEERMASYSSFSTFLITVLMLAVVYLAIYGGLYLTLPEVNVSVYLTQNNDEYYLFVSVQNGYILYNGSVHGDSLFLVVSKDKLYGIVDEIIIKHGENEASLSEILDEASCIRVGVCHEIHGTWVVENDVVRVMYAGLYVMIVLLLVAFFYDYASGLWKRWERRKKIEKI